MKKLISLEEAIKASRKETKKWHQNINPSLAQLLSLLGFDKRYLKAEGVFIWDEDGKKYLDFLAGYGSLNLGHNHPKVVEALRKVSSLPNLLQASLNPLAGALAHNLSLITPDKLDKAFFCNSGAEAVEGALKLARAATGKEKIIFTENSFHGKTLGALSVTGRIHYQEPFKPLIPQCSAIPYGNLKALEKEIVQGDVAAFIVEPIQGEGGVNIPPDGYLKGAEELCQKHQTLLIFDEVQTGLGRTGKMFACEWEDAKPDIICLAKSLGGGLMPIGAYLTKEKIWSSAYGGIKKCLRHTSTFGGNTLACAAALATLEVILEENLIEKAKEEGAYFLSKLKELKEKHPIIKDVRGRGLLIGIEFEQPAKSWLNKASGGLISQLSKEYFASMVAAELLNNYQIITAYTLNNPNVIRLEPPLIIKRKEIDYAIKSLDEVCEKGKNLWRMSLKTSQTIIKRIFKK